MGEEGADAPATVFAAARALLATLGEEGEEVMEAAWDSAVFDRLPASLAAVLECRLEVWRVAEGGRVVRDVFKGVAGVGREGSADAGPATALEMRGGAAEVQGGAGAGPLRGGSVGGRR